MNTTSVVRIDQPKQDRKEGAAKVRSNPSHQNATGPRNTNVAPIDRTTEREVKTITERRPS